MLIEFIEKAVAIGSDSIEIEYKDRKEWVFAFSGPMGVGIGCLEPDKAKPLFKEMDELKKTKRVVLGGVIYRLVFSRYESFGEWVHRIEIKVARSQTVSKHRSSRRA